MNEPTELIKAKQMIARLQTVIRRAQHEEVSPCPICKDDDTQEDCLRCLGTKWITTIKQDRRALPPPEVPIAPETLHEVEKALRATGKGHLGTYGFLDVTVQPYGGMYSNPYPYGEPFEVRLIKSNYHEQQRRDAAALAQSEAAYLAAPEGDEE